MVLAAVGSVSAAYNDPDTRQRDCLCAYAQGLGQLLGLRVHSGTARFDGGAYTCNMQLISIKAIFAMLWVSAVSIAGFAGNVRSLSGWAVLAGLAILPLVMLWRWNDPRPTMSETIREALR
jgi:hypothetical protein